MPKSKVFASFADAVRDIPDGSVVGFGGFAVVGMPINLYEALTKQGAKRLTCVSNGTRGGATMPEDAPTMEWLIRNDQVRKAICSFTAPTRASQRLALTEYVDKGLIDAELVPQGTLAERMRAAGAGIPAFFTPTAVGTKLAAGKEQRQIAGRQYLLEEALAGDVALIEAWEADRWGNLTYRSSARNFNPVMAVAATLTIAQAQHIVDLGALDPEKIATPGIYVNRVLHVPYGEPTVT